MSVTNNCETVPTISTNHTDTWTFELSFRKIYSIVLVRPTSSPDVVLCQTKYSFPLIAYNKIKLAKYLLHLVIYEAPMIYYLCFNCWCRRRLLMLFSSIFSFNILFTSFTNIGAYKSTVIFLQTLRYISSILQQTVKG